MFPSHDQCAGTVEVDPLDIEYIQEDRLSTEELDYLQMNKGKDKELIDWIIEELAK